MGVSGPIEVVGLRDTAWVFLVMLVVSTWACGIDVSLDVEPVNLAHWKHAAVVVLRPEILDSNVAVEFKGKLVDVHIHVVLARDIVDVAVTEQSTQRVAVDCRSVGKVDSLHNRHLEGFFSEVDDLVENCVSS